MNHALATLAVPSGERHTRSLRPNESVQPLPPVFKKLPWNVGRESQLPGEPRFALSSHSRLTRFRRWVTSEKGIQSRK